MVSFVLMVATIRVNALFFLVFFALVMLFAFVAAADFRVASAATLADQEYILYLLKIGGGFGFIGLICGWYVFSKGMAQATRALSGQASDGIEMTD